MVSKLPGTEAGGLRVVLNEAPQGNSLRSGYRVIESICVLVIGIRAHRIGNVDLAIGGLSEWKKLIKRKRSLAVERRVYLIWLAIYRLERSSERERNGAEVA